MRTSLCSKNYAGYIYINQHSIVSAAVHVFHTNGNKIIYPLLIAEYTHN